MNRFKITICIPTYNRAEMLGQLLESIISQNSLECVEVAISDNASTDNTSEIIDVYKRKGLNIKYHREGKNRGADFNYLNAVNIATGDYCWLYGSDDLMPKGALAHVLDTIKNTSACIILGPRQNFDNKGNLCDVEQWLASEDRYFDTSSNEGFKNYMRNATGIGALFSYLSSIVVCRRNWNAVTVHTSYIGTAYSHVHALMQIALKHGIYYTATIIAFNRTNNDSFLADGEIRRVMIDLEGYAKLSNDLFPDLHDVRKYEFLSVLRKSRPAIKTLVSLRIRQSKNNWIKSKKIFLACGYTALLISIISAGSPLLKAIYISRSYLRRAIIK